MVAFRQNSAAGTGSISSRSLSPKPITLSVSACLVHAHDGLDDRTAKPDAAAILRMMGVSGELSELGHQTKQPELGAMRRVSGVLRRLGSISKPVIEESATEARLLRRRAAQRRILTCCGMCIEG
jgi:hypothetical protein